MPAPTFAGEALETIAERVERELERLKAARPHLAGRIERAGNILVTHLSCRRQRVIRVRVGRDGRARSSFPARGARCTWWIPATGLARAPTTTGAGPPASTR